MYKIWYRGEALLGYGYDNFKGNDTHNFFFFLNTFKMLSSLQKSDPGKDFQDTL